MNAGAHAGLGGIVFAGLFIGAGPHLGLGGKWTTKQGLVIDMNAGVTGLITHYSRRVWYDSYSNGIHYLRATT